MFCTTLLKKKRKHTQYHNVQKWFYLESRGKDRYKIHILWYTRHVEAPDGGFVGYPKNKSKPMIIVILCIVMRMHPPKSNNFIWIISNVTEWYLWWHTSVITCQIMMSTCQIFMLTCQIIMSTCQKNITTNSS